MSVYIYRIIAAAIIASIATAFSSLKGGHGKLVKMIAGLFLLITIIAPLTELSTVTFEGFDIRQDGHNYAQDGQLQANHALREIITQRCEAYVMEKAISMGVDVDVKVSLNDDEYPSPCGITMSGAVSPYTKIKLQEMIASDLGIAKEQQIWT